MGSRRGGLASVALDARYYKRVRDMHASQSGKSGARFGSARDGGNELA